MKSTRTPWSGRTVAIGVGLLALASCPKQNDEAAAKKLEDRLTDQLAFTGGTVKEGDPPAAHDGDLAYPQVSGLTGPTNLVAGQPFNLQFMVAANELGNVKGAVVHVTGATKYVEVVASLQGDAMTLSATFNGDSELAGKSFEVQIAAQDTAGAVGNYITWSVQVPAAGSAVRPADGGLVGEGDATTGGGVDSSAVEPLTDAATGGAGDASAAPPGDAAATGFDAAL